ncbi:hypothetical protein [Streptomyces sp. DH8]|uniref:hypothetical protein n=1 Tax=Streptomyces sp. DH8 TaxID=2857008 RepID=UPI001E3FF0A2|nr:hypothetical protein [Streptomyces sp. DH8]
MPDTSPTPADRPADLLRAAVRAIHALKSPMPEGSRHYQSGWDDGLEAAMDAVRDMDLAVARQLLGASAAAPPVEEQEPTPLRWGLDDVMYGDDDTTTVLLSGPGREPYWLELDPERTAALRDALAGPAAPPAPADRAAVLREAADLLAELGTPIFGERSEHERGLMYGAERLRRLADDAAAGVQPPTTSEAHRPCVEYIAEVLEDDGVWMYLGADPDPAVAARRRAHVTRRHPNAQTRTVRKTTTYTVEPEPAAPAAPEEPTR